VTIAAVGGTSWTDIMSAFGTVGAVVAAVGIALWAEWRSGRRLKAERERGARLLAEERAHSRAQIDEERRVTREREQLAEAYAVQVIAADMVIRSWPEESITRGRHLAAIVVNRGKFTIMRVSVQFCTDGVNLVPAGSHERVSGLTSIPESLKGGFSEISWLFTPGGDGAMYGVLPPWDEGIRFQSDTLPVESLKSPYPLVRWTDRWGTRWQYRLGEVDEVGNDDTWYPWPLR
jgi:hypothetical protein